MKGNVDGGTIYLRAESEGELKALLILADLLQGNTRPWMADSRGVSLQIAWDQDLKPEQELTSV